MHKTGSYLANFILDSQKTPNFEQTPHTKLEHLTFIELKWLKFTLQTADLLDNLSNDLTKMEFSRTYENDHRKGG